MATGGMGMFPDQASGELLLIRNGFVLPDDYDGDMVGVLETVNNGAGFRTRPFGIRMRASAFKSSRTFFGCWISSLAATRSR
jgi:hypothetical protein